MSANVATAVGKSNLGPARAFTLTRKSLQTNSIVMRVARGLWPTKTAQELAYRTSTSERMARYWLSQRYDLSADDLTALLRSEEGFKILEAIMGQARPIWWRRFKRKTKREHLREQIKQFELELEGLDAAD